jgi:hypothetical protein
VRNGLEYCVPVRSPFLTGSDQKATKSSYENDFWLYRDREQEANLLLMQVQHHIQCALVAEKLRRMPASSALKIAASEVGKMCRTLYLAIMDSWPRELI